ncbi:hypothetical protein HDU83_002693 [Entophlyctis luteolus]|nr:hypothetical protein HDU83_002693 [Entophlyctis luteolus]
MEERTDPDDLSQPSHATVAPSRNPSQKLKRKKVSQACLYCRRSHMTCDVPSTKQIQDQDQGQSSLQTVAAPPALYSTPSLNFVQPQFTLDAALPQQSSESVFPNLFQGGQTGNELAIISNFLASLESPVAAHTNLNITPSPGNLFNPVIAPGRDHASVAQDTSVLPPETEQSLSSTERFVLAAADPATIGTNEDRLNQVISAKFEAGLLKPYNYINSYKKLNAWMETHMSPASRSRILNVMGLFRPRFRWVAQRLTDMDLVLVEEAFERMLLEYDRVFSSMGIPSCLWRRTGEIWKCNKEFAQLIGLPMELLKDGKLSIYELMSEESAVNYWEKYGNIAFDAGQKAILTSCILKKPDEDRESAAARTQREGVSCCFSFTIRRDRYSIPIIIAGNFLPIF